MVFDAMALAEALVDRQYDDRSHSVEVLEIALQRAYNAGLHARLGDREGLVDDMVSEWLKRPKGSAREWMSAALDVVLSRLDTSPPTSEKGEP